jgi:hypothetical protein
MNFEEYLARQIAVSRCNFGPNERHKGVIEHIRSELEEIEAEATPAGRAGEWVDVVILALDGLTRAVRANADRVAEGATANEIAGQAVKMIREKQQGKNELRDWPDWRTIPEDRAIEHTPGSHD